MLLKLHHQHHFHHFVALDDDPPFSSTSLSSSLRRNSFGLPEDRTLKTQGHEND